MDGFTPVVGDAIFPPDPIPVVPPILPVPGLTLEQRIAAIEAKLGGLPADRSGAVSWDHVGKILWVPNA